MTISLNTTELQTLQTKETQAKSSLIGYWEIYKWLADTLEGKGVASTDQTVLWLRGATEANAGRGAMSELIRVYTETQYQLRYGTPLLAGKMQEASNAVAQNVMDDLLGRNPPWPAGQIPDIARIAKSDASAVGDTLFGNKLGHDVTDTAFLQNSAWSGSLLFSLLRSDQTGSLMSTGTSGSIDTLNDFRDVLYAYKAYETGFSAARSALLFESAAQALVDEKIFGSTTWGYITSTAAVLPLKDAVVLGTDNPTLKIAFKAIADVGSNKFLDMLMGAVQGKSLIGTTTDGNFTANANTFLGALTPAQLQAIGAQLMPTDAGGLAALAHSETASGSNARAALAALSIVSVQVSNTVAAQFSLYNPATGTGNITDTWLQDRAAFTANYYTQQQRGGGILPGTSNLRYFDAASNTEVLVGAGATNAQRVQYLFGGDSADTLEGKGFADHLYGGAGADTLSGLGGNDLIEGGAGADLLIGGEGTDTLVGDTGFDTYQFDAGFGNDTVLDSDGQGTIRIGTTVLTGGKKLSDNLWESDDKTTIYLQQGADLLIGQRAVAGAGTVAGTITVKNWSSGQLGISLQNTAVPVASTGATGPINVYLTNPIDPGTVHFNTNVIADIQLGGVMSYTDLNPILFT